MLFVAHRINTINELKKVNVTLGIEIDIRSWNDTLILQHDPYKNGEKLKEFFKFYKHKFIILNVKSEGLEYAILDLLVKYNIKNYFFLDCSFPMIYKLIKLGERNIAIRYSELEGIDTLVNLSNKIDWVWVDCFTKFPLTGNIYSKLKSLNYKICIVSPELQSHDITQIDTIKDIIKKNNMAIDAVCSKIYNCCKWKL